MFQEYRKQLKVIINNIGVLVSLPFNFDAFSYFIKLLHNKAPSKHGAFPQCCLNVKTALGECLVFVRILDMMWKLQ